MKYGAFCFYDCSFTYIDVINKFGLYFYHMALCAILIHIALCKHTHTHTVFYCEVTELLLCQISFFICFLALRKVSILFKLLPVYEDLYMKTFI